MRKESTAPQGIDDFNSPFWQEVLREADKFADLPIEEQKRIIEDRRRMARLRLNALKEEQQRDVEEEWIQKVVGQ